MIYNTSNI